MERRNLIGSRLRQARLAERPQASDIQLVALAKALKVSPAWLLGLDEPEK